jgi:Arc/MetJ family transcription regulator
VLAERLLEQVPSFADMVTHMKTTIEISDALLAEARKVAAREKTTLRELVEFGLRHSLQTRRQKKQSFKLKLVTAGGEGLRPGISDDLPRSLAYDLPPLEPR